MPINSRINKSSLSAKQKRQVRAAFKAASNVAVLASNYTHTQSNTTLANISGFSLPVVGGKTYIYTISLTCTGNASGGAKFGVTGPTASFVTGQVHGPGTGGGSTSLASITAGATAAAVEFLATGTYKPSTDGTFQIQAAQNASHASDSIVLAGSFVKLEEVI